MTEAHRVLDEAIAHAPPTRSCGRGRRSSASSCAWRPRRAPAATDARRVADAALAVLERDGDEHGQCRAWSLRAQVAWIAGQRRARRRRVGRPPTARAAPATSASCSTSSAGARPPPCSGPTPVDEAIRRCEGFRDARRRQPGRGGLDAQPARVAARDERATFELARAFLREANDVRSTSSAASTPASRTSRRSCGCSPAGRTLAEVALRGGVDEARRDGRQRAAGDDDARCSPRRSTPRAGSTRPASCAAWPRPPRPTTTSSPQVIWRGVQAKILARDGRRERGRGARPRGGRARRADRLALAPRRCDARPRRGARACSRRGRERARRSDTALALYERRATPSAAARARALLAQPVRPRPREGSRHRTRG